MVIDLMKAVYFASMLVIITAAHLLKIFLLQLWYFLTRRTLETSRVHEIAIDWGRAVIALTPGWRVESSGLEHLPPAGKSCVIVANHESATDILAIYTLGIQFRWLAKSSVFSIPFFGWGIRAAGYVPVNRGNKQSHTQALSDSANWLKAGVPMLFFPEGTRSTLGYPQKFKIGAFKLAADCGVEVLPMALSGAGKLLRKGTVVPNAATMKVRVLPPTSLQSGESIDEFTERVHKIITEAHRELLS